MQIRELQSEQLKMVENFGICLIQFYDSSSQKDELIKKEIEKIPEEGLYFHALRFDINSDIESARIFNAEESTLLMIKGDKILGRNNEFTTAQEIHDWAHFSTIMGW